MKRSSDEIAAKIANEVIELIGNPTGLDVLPKIISLLEDYQKKHQSKGEVISAVKLDNAYIAKLEKLLSKKLDEPVHLSNTVDKTLLGGFIIRFRDMIIDQSVKKQLEELKNQAYETR